MKILLCEPRGFCAGVDMAIECVESVLKLQGPPLYVYHEIVHNRHVVQSFVDRGVTFVDDVADVPQGATLVYSAHGVSPAVRAHARRRGIVEVDATCPLVAKVHTEAVQFARRAFDIVLIGHADHDEIVGTVGEAPDCTHVVGSVADVERLHLPPGRPVAYLTQTTLSVSEAQAIIAALRGKYPAIQGPRKEDICYATTNRQHAVRELAAECDVVLVVGSQNSSNCRRLVETAVECGVPGYLLDDVTSLRPEWIAEARTVLLTAGASTPEDYVRQVLHHLIEQHGASVEPRLVATEDVRFESPLSLRVLAARHPAATAAAPN